MTPKKTISPENALARVAALCSRSEQAEHDIRIKLCNWGIQQDSIEKIITRLIDEKYIDEQRYAIAFTRDKFRFDGWGRIKIAYSLRNKHISSNVIENALAEIYDNEYIQSLEHLLRNKLRSLNKKNDIQKKASLLRFATSRGYEPGLIYSILPKIINCDEDF